MGFTAIVMSKEEAMALPLKDRPICYRISEPMYMAIWEAVGAASHAWRMEGTNEVYANEHAEKVAVDLCFKVANEIEAKTIPLSAQIAKLERENAELNKALALKLDAMPSGLSAGQSKVLEDKLARLVEFIATIADGEADQDTKEYEAYRLMTGAQREKSK